MLKRRLEEINPFATIQALPEIYSEESSGSFHLEQYDYIIDAIDSLTHKHHLLVAASNTGATVYSSMGAALKMDPLQIRVAEFWKVRGCKLGTALRERMKRKGEKLAKPILCVYSEEMAPNKEEPLTEANENSNFHKARINGTMVHVTATFGFVLSGLVIQDIAKQYQSAI